MRNATILFAAAWLLLPAAGGAEPAREHAGPTVGLVLAGGGARGAAHVGVIKVLEELDIRPDLVAGTSVGAIIGGMYAAGLDAADLEQMLAEMDWDRVFSDDPGRAERTMRRKQLDRDFVVPRRLGFDRRGLQVPLGVLQGQHLDQALNRILGEAVTVRDFDELPIPFRAVATDLATGGAVILGSGSLVQAIRASMSVPGIFAPVTIDDRLLVDGGLAMNTPVEVAREMGADVLIVVDLRQPLLGKDELDSVVRITEQLGSILTRRNIEQSLARMGEGDILIEPQLDDFGATQFERALEAMAAGEAAAREAIEPLRALAGRLAPRPPPEAVATHSRVVEFIDIHNSSPIDDAVLRSRLSVQPGDTLDLHDLESGLDAIYALDVFEVVRYDIVEDPDRGTGVVIQAESRSWGPNYMQFGLELVSDFNAIQEFSIGAAYTRNAMNRLGADLRISGSIGRFSALKADFHQPLDRTARWFVQPTAAWQRDRRDIYDGTTNLGTQDITRWGVGLGGGRNIGQRMQLRADYAVARENVSVVRGFPQPDRSGRISRGELSAAALYDSLNNINFPTHGSQLELHAIRSDSRLGADREFNQYRFTGITAATRGRWSVVSRGMLGSSSGDELPLADLFQLGGFGQISGLPPDSLLGEHAGLLAVSGQRRIADLRLLPVYAGVTLEAGNIWQRRSEMSFSDLRYAGSTYLGIDSFLGPFYLALGMDDDGNASFYFYLGNPFELRRR